jgi:hypothetical protein
MERPDRAVEAEVTVALRGGCGEDGTVGPRATGAGYSTNVDFKDATALFRYISLRDLAGSQFSSHND